MYDPEQYYCLHAAVEQLVRRGVDEHHLAAVIHAALLSGPPAILCLPEQLDTAPGCLSLLREHGVDVADVYIGARHLSNRPLDDMDVMHRAYCIVTWTPLSHARGTISHLRSLVGVRHLLAAVAEQMSYATDDSPIWAAAANLAAAAHRASVRAVDEALLDHVAIAAAKNEV